MTPCAMRRLRDRGGERGIRLTRRGVDEFGGDHRAVAAHVADAAGRPPELPQPLRRGSRSISCARSSIPSCSNDVDRGERRGAGDRVAAVGAAEAAGVRGVHDLGAPGHRGERQAAGDALGGRDQVGDDAEHARSRTCAPVRAKPVWISSAMKTTSLARHQSTSAGRKPSAGTMKPPSPWIGSMMTAARLSAPTCFSMTRDGLLRRLGAGEAVAEGVRQRARGRPRTRTARTRSCTACLRGERHREVGAAVVAVVERDDGLLAWCTCGRS